MRVEGTPLPGVLLIEPKRHSDTRGSLFEAWNARRYEAAGIDLPFVQDNVSRSSRGVLRGLHMQHPQAQGKLVQALAGEVFDVAVDARADSTDFGRWTAAVLSGDNAHQLWIPPGFLHGFCVLSEQAVFSYKCTAFYDADVEIGVVWDDAEIGIDWPIDAPILSGKDAGLPRLRDIPRARLPTTSDYV